MQWLKRPRANIMTKEVKFKIQKPCKYFNSSRGCRNGSNCHYQHDMLGMSRITKRLKGTNTYKIRVLENPLLPIVILTSLSKISHFPLPRTLTPSKGFISQSPPPLCSTTTPQTSSEEKFLTH
ncbi:Zinc finger CCCH domain-containing protein 30, partial [Mucuna pruriens]